MPMKILLVDDDENYLWLLEKILVPHGYEILKCKDGESALKTIKNEHVDLVLLDVIMPGMSGFETAKKIKQEKEIPVILLTALGEKEDLLTGLANGADEFLTKPFLKEELLLRVDNMLKIKGYQNTLEEMVSKRTSELADALSSIRGLNKEILSRLLVAAEYRDDDTGNHIVRVGKYSEIVADCLLLEPKFRELIGAAAPMHDIGKIAIPDSILLKPGRLTPHEHELMKTHTTIGASILKESKFPMMVMACEIALNHHERWDGHGYPGGLCAEQIPLTGRIVAIADVFDALTSRRPYKEPFSWERSMDIIMSERGKTFDPCVVDSFAKGTERLRAVYDEYNKPSQEKKF